MEVVYGAHEFEAENQDEISFRIGERILVIEKDDQYHDGWWQGENEAGQRGLFPQNYTLNTRPSAGESLSPLTAQNGTFASSSQSGGSNGASIPTSGDNVRAVQQSDSMLQPGRPDSSMRKDSQSGPSEMRATINDIQNHLNEMHLANGSQGGAITGSSTSAALAGGSSSTIPPPPPVSRGYSIDETSSLASHSTRDDASSITGGEESSRYVTENHRDSVSTAGDASQAKENLARNIQLAQEKEDRRRREEEHQREAERERLRTSSGPPVEGLVLTDESDIEEGDDDDDDDSIFPSRQRHSGDLSASRLDEEDERVPTPNQEETPHLGSGVSRFSAVSARDPTTPPITAPTVSTQPPAVDEEEENSSYPTPAIEERESSSYLAQGTLADPAIASEQSLEQAAPAGTAMEAPRSEDVEDLSGNGERDQEGNGAPAVATPLLDMPGALAPDDAQGSNTESESKPSELQQGPYGAYNREADNKDDSDLPKRDITPLNTSSKASPIPSISQVNPTSSGRYSADAAGAPGKEGLLTLVQQAQTATPAPIVTGSARQSTNSTQSAVQATSPNQSTAGSSRPSSNLGTAFTPATSAPYEASPRSATFPSRTPTMPDPREWTVDQVIEWGQTKNLDGHVLGKFREHEISGDVLVEMDINTLKEIDILAFGPRARIARAIKELNAKYYGLPILSPGSSSYINELPTTPESYNAPPSAQSATFPRNYMATPSSSATPSQSYQTSPVAAQMSNGSGQDNLRGLGLAQGSPGQNVNAAPVTSMNEHVQTADVSRSNTVHTRGTTVDTDESFSTGDNVQEELAQTTPKEPTSDTLPASVPSSDRRRQKSAIGSTVSGAFNRHNRQKSTAPSVAESNTGSLETGDKTTKTVGRTFFGSRSRKPPPQYQASETDSTSIAEKPTMTRSPSTAPAANRLSSRFFTFGGSSGPSSPPAATGDRSRRNISAPLEATSVGDQNAEAEFEPRRPSPVTPGARDSVSAEPSSYMGAAEPIQETQEQAAPKILTQAERIGDPDYSGWLRKKTDKYNGWKDRYLILKDSYLYVLKSPAEEKVKGYINLSGYRFVSDGSVGSGLSEKSRYGFKAIHDSLPTHYFSSSDSVIIRNWMKALMKATIGRDYSAPVTSSSNIKTIPLSVAQAMNPPPRPPSPNSAIRMQKASVKQNPNSLSPTDAAKLMGAQTITPSPSGMVRSGSNNALLADKKGQTNSPTKRKTGSLLPPLRSTQRKKPAEVSPVMARSASTTSRPGFGEDNRRNSWYEKRSDRIGSASPRESMGTTRSRYLSPQEAETPTPVQAFFSNPAQDVLDWLNSQSGPGVQPAETWQDLRSGKVYTRVVERSSGKSSGISDAQFAKFAPLQPGKTPDMSYVDILFNCFDFLLDNGVKTEDVSINDLLTGNEPHLIKLGEIIRRKYAS